eukprot:12785818-Heterocapsa_arctica.AAC.1
MSPATADVGRRFRKAVCEFAAPRPPISMLHVSARRRSKDRGPFAAPSRSGGGPSLAQATASLLFRPSLACQCLH